MVIIVILKAFTITADADATTDGDNDFDDNNKDITDDNYSINNKSCCNSYSDMITIIMRITITTDD